MVVEGVEYSGFCLKRAERNHEKPWSGFPVSELRGRFECKGCVFTVVINGRLLFVRSSTEDDGQSTNVH
jgi:hypothetical protein